MTLSHGHTGIFAFGSHGAKPISFQGLIKCWNVGKTHQKAQFDAFTMHAKFGKTQSIAYMLFFLNTAPLPFQNYFNTLSINVEKITDGIWFSSENFCRVR